MKRLVTVTAVAALALSAAGAASAADVNGASAWSHAKGSAAWSTPLERNSLRPHPYLTKSRPAL
jgi:hypothetical protein